MHHVDRILVLAVVKNERYISDVAAWALGNLAATSQEVAFSLLEQEAVELLREAEHYTND